MKESFKARKITDTVYWVGAIDWNITDFHGYATKRGTTYNAFLILADDITLVDTVKEQFKDEMMARIASLVDPEDISVIISNHIELDHSGSLPSVIAKVKPERVYASKMGIKAIKGHFHDDFSITAIEDGGSVSLGNMDVSFIETRMLHWPDSMFTYLPGEGILFSQDAFGMHLASNELFADEIDNSILEYEAAKYFANILLPYSHLILRLLDRVAQLGIDISMIAPDHGPIWRTPDDIGKVKGWYVNWAEQKPSKRAVIVYDTMWNSTDTMARAIGEGLSDNGINVKVMSMHSSHRSDVATEMLDAGALIVGSPTLNSNMFPTVADVMVYLRGLRPKNLIGVAFGSYGWGGEAIKQIEGILEEMKVERVAETVKVQYVPVEDDLNRCFELGKQIAGKLQNLTND
ncbi:FprA family A-type flavoprotein [Candidatus Latescibacterota bacterium]